MVGWQIPPSSPRNILGKSIRITRNCNAAVTGRSQPSQFHIFHRIVILAFKLTIESDVLVDRKRLSSCVSCDQLNADLEANISLMKRWRAEGK